MPQGIPMTNDERRMRHKMIHGDSSEPPAERIGRNPMPVDRTGQYPVIIGEEGGATRVVYARHDELPDASDALVAPILVAAGKGGLFLLKWLATNKMITVALIAGTSLLYGGLKLTQAAYEKVRRRGLQPFQFVVAAPKPGEVNDAGAKYALAVVGAVPGRKVMIKFGKGKAFGYSDEVFREGYGDFAVEVTARELAEAAQDRKFLIGSIPGLRESGDVTVSMYAQEERTPMMRDLRTPIEPVKIHIPTEVERTFEHISGTIPCITGPRGVSAATATAGYAAGKRYYIKSSLPILCCLPGLPYVPGMWVPPMCVISETA